MARRSGLGKGLSAIIPEGVGGDGGAGPEGSELRELPISSISINPNQPRAVFDPDALESLAASISSLGVLQPVLVRATGSDTFELIAGERRWRASQLAGLTSIPALVRHVDDNHSLQQALVENLHREDLNPLEEAAGYQQLIDDFSLTQEEVAERVGRSRSAVANTLRLLVLPPGVQELLVARSLTAGHARALLAVEDPADQQALADRVVEENLTVRATEEAVRRLVAAQFPDDTAAGQPTGQTPRPAALLELEDVLSEHFSTRVAVKMSGKRGRVTVEFATLDDLDRIYRLMLGLTGESSD